MVNQVTQQRWGTTASYTVVTVHTGALFLVRSPKFRIFEKQGTTPAQYKESQRRILLVIIATVMNTGRPICR